MTWLGHIFINQNRSHYNHTFLPTRNKFVFYCSVKICASGFDELLESIFCLLLGVEAFSLQKVVQMLEQKNVQEVFISLINRLLKITNR